MEEQPKRKNTGMAKALMCITIAMLVGPPLLISIYLLRESKQNDKTESLTKPAIVSDKKSYEDPDSYRVTFELANGESLKLQVDSKVYDQLQPGEQGELRYQGTRFVRFKYSSPVFTDWGVVRKNELNPDFAAAGEYEQYFIRIQLSSGEIIKLGMSSRDSTWASWGQYGRVTYQGTRLTSFKRTERSQGDTPSQALSVVAQKDPRKQDGTLQLIQVIALGAAVPLGIWLGIRENRKREREQA